MKERYYSESLLRSLAYKDDTNGNCDGKIDFTVIDCLSGADVTPVIHGKWIDTGTFDAHYSPIFQCSECYKEVADNYISCHKYCLHCGAEMDGGNK